MAQAQDTQWIIEQFIQWVESQGLKLTVSKGLRHKYNTDTTEVYRVYTLWTAADAVVTNSRDMPLRFSSTAPEPDAFLGFILRIQGCGYKLAPGDSEIHRAPMF